MPINPTIDWNEVDWRGDTETIRPETRGIYRDILGHLHMKSQCVITGTREQLAAAGRCTVVQLDVALQDLRDRAVCDITERNGIVTLACRRLQREAKAREQRRNRVAAFRSGRPCNAPVTTAPLIRADKGDKAFSSLSDLTEKGIGEKPSEQPDSNACNTLVTPKKRDGNTSKNTNNHRHMIHNCAPMKRTCNASVTPRKLTDSQRELAERFEIVLGAQWVNDAGKWVNRLKEIDGKTGEKTPGTFAKSERVVAEVESAITESRIKTTPAQYAEQIWKEFK